MRLSQFGILLAAASLASCYAQVEDGSVQVTHSLCTPSTNNCIPGGGVALSTNNSTFDMITGGADFKGLTQVQLLKALRASTGPTDDPCAAPANCPVLAAYNQATDGVADQHIVLKSQVSNLIDLIDPINHNIIFEVTAKGTAPQPAFWSADFTMDLGLKARAGVP